MDKKIVADLVDAVHTQDADVAMKLLDEANRKGGPCGVRDLAKAASQLGSNVNFNIDATATQETISLTRMRYGYGGPNHVVSLTVGRCER